jgi:hypothetical protein
MHVLTSGFVELGLELVRGLELALRRDLFVAAAAVNDVHHVGPQLRRACPATPFLFSCSTMLVGCAGWAWPPDICGRRTLRALEAVAGLRSCCRSI